MNIIRTYLDRMKWFFALTFYFSNDSLKGVHLLITIVLFLISWWIKTKTVKIHYLQRTPEDQKRQTFRKILGLVLIFSLAILGAILDTFNLHPLIPGLFGISAFLLLPYFSHQMSYWK